MRRGLTVPVSPQVVLVQPEVMAQLVQDGDADLFAEPIFANVAAVLAMVGSIMLLMGRLGRKDKVNKGTWFDWYGVILLNAVIATGILTQFARLTDVAVLAFTIYTIHLILVYCLLTYIPFSKLAHMFYRTLAMHHGRLTGRVPPGDPLEAAR